jgi:hypothetical protein
MKTVALFGFAEITRDQILRTDAEEVWTVNRGWHYNIRVDRLFEMHSFQYISDPHNNDTREAIKRREELDDPTIKSHWDWLSKEEHIIPVYMQEAYPEIHNSVRYPIEGVMEDVFSRIKIGKKRVANLGSTIDMMLALAIFEGVERIELYGIEMLSGTEYNYQRTSAYGLMNFAAGRGIDVVLPAESNLITKLKLYGYDAEVQMISRQTLEAHLQDKEASFKQWTDITNAKVGAVEALKKNKVDIEVVKEAEKEVFQAIRMRDSFDVLIQEYQFLIDECDMLETESEFEISNLPLFDKYVKER